MPQEQAGQLSKEDETNKYLESHRILDLLNNLTAQVLHARPNNPKEFMIEKLETLKKSKAVGMGHPCLFDESNIISIFGMLDPTGKGFITLEQYKQALVTLGVQEYNLTPAGGEQDKIALETFAHEAKVGLGKASATFTTQRQQPNMQY